MPLFGTFLYGSGPTYGVESRIEFIREDLVKVTLDYEVLLNEAYFDVSNYTIALAGGDGSSAIVVRAILKPSDDSVKTSDTIYIRTGPLQRGVEYELYIAGLTSSSTGTVVDNLTVPRTYRRTKVDSILSSCPSHFDKRPGSILGGLMTAIGISDNKIGGTFDESVD